MLELYVSYLDLGHRKKKKRKREEKVKVDLEKILNEELRPPGDHLELGRKAASQDFMR